MKSAFRNSKISVNPIDGKGGVLTKGGVKRKYIQSCVRSRCDKVLTILESATKPITREQLSIQLQNEGYSTSDVTTALSKLIRFELVWYSAENKIKTKKRAREALAKIV
jgi:recombinational DNA repair protein (RecF pathway)